MRTQFDPGGLAQAGAAGHGFFLAVYPETASRSALEGLACAERRAACLRGMPRPARLLHATLLSLGRHDGPDEEVDRRIDLAKAACARLAHPCFEVRFDEVMSFAPDRNGKCPVVAVGGEGVGALSAFRRALLAAIGLAPSTGYKPHVTLLYDRRVVDPHGIVPIGWTVREFCLVHSLIGHSRHDILARWPLGTPGTPRPAQ